KNQYAAVGAASRAALAEVVSSIDQAHDRPGQGNVELLDQLLAGHRDRLKMATQYVEAYRRYCWPVRSVADLKLAPFHLLASEGQVHVGKDPVWHMETLRRLAASGPPLMETSYRVIDLTRAESVAEGARWWEELTGR